jgi:hypothetical protein
MAFSLPFHAQRIRLKSKATVTQIPYQIAASLIEIGRSPFWKTPKSTISITNTTNKKTPQAHIGSVIVAQSPS